MNLIFDISHAFHKSYSVYTNWNKNVDLNLPEVQQALTRKFLTDFCHSIRIFENLNIDRVICCMDGRTNWRKNVYPDYKGNRESKEKAFYDIRDNCQRLLSKAGFIIHKDNMLEGDDLMAMWSQFISQSGEKCIILSADGDIRMLVDENVVVYSNNSKMAEIYYVKQQLWFANFSSIIKVTYQEVSPEWITFEKTLLGDKGDNVPKLTKRGVGYQRVLKLFNYSEKFLSNYEDVFYICEEEDAFDENITLEIFLQNKKLIDLNNHTGPLNVVKRNFEAIIEKSTEYSYDKPFEMKYIYDEN